MKRDKEGLSKQQNDKGWEDNIREKGSAEGWKLSFFERRKKEKKIRKKKENNKHTPRATLKGQHAISPLLELQLNRSFSCSATVCYSKSFNEPKAVCGEDHCKVTANVSHHRQRITALIFEPFCPCVLDVISTPFLSFISFLFIEPSDKN